MNRSDIFEPWKYDGNLPNLGNGIDFRPFPRIQDGLQAAKQDYEGLSKYLDQAKQNPLYRIGVERNINPEFTNFMGGLLGPMVQNQIKKGLLDFNVEVPGFNSNRYYMGLNWRF